MRRGALACGLNAHLIVIKLRGSNAHHIYRVNPIYRYIYVYICIYMYICVCVRVPVSVYVCLCVNVYIDHDDYDDFLLISNS